MTRGRVLRRVALGLSGLVAVPVLAAGALVVVVPPPVEDFAAATWSPGPGSATPAELVSDASAEPGSDEVHGPEDVAVDADGRVYTGDRDGDLLRVLPDGSTEVFAHVGGRPLGLRFAGEDLLVANHGLGLQSVSPDGEVTLLVDEVAGRPVLFANDLDVGDDGVVWFSDSSRDYTTTTLGDVPSYLVPALLDGRATGRLLRHDLASGVTTQVLDGLHFPNGVALSASGDQVWVVESTRYRVLRYSVADGTTDVVLDDVPGVPDGVTRDDDGSMLVALSERTAALDDLVLPHAVGRHLMIRLPDSLFVSEDDPLSGSVLVVTADGRVAAQHTGIHPAPTNVVPYRGTWYVGALLGQPVRSLPAPDGG